MRNRKLAIMMIFLIIFQLTAGTFAVAADGGSGLGDASVTEDVYGVTDDVYGISDNFGMSTLMMMNEPIGPEEICETVVCVSSDYSLGKVVLGMERTIDIHMENDTGAYQNNLGIELVLENGLAIVSPEPSSVEIDEEGIQTVYWKDVKNLQAGEEFTFPVTIESTDTYRVSGAEVPFGTEVPTTVNLYHSTDARVIEGPGNSAPDASVSLDWTVVPFTIIPSDGVKVVKGAGEDAEGTNEWGEFAFSFEIINNSRSATTFDEISSITDGSVQIYDLSDDGEAAADLAGSVRSFDWTGLTVGDGDTKVLEFRGAFLDRGMSTDPEGENLGTQITDGFRPLSTLEYSGSPVGGGSYPNGSGEGTYNYNLAVAKDIVVHKSVETVPVDERIGYETELEYTLTVKTNEYYEVADVVVTDTIGDGQTVLSVESTPGDFTLVTPATGEDNEDGTWKLEWSDTDGLLEEEQVRTFVYRTKVNSNWSGDGAYDGDPIYAGDRIVNDVTVTGTTTVSDAVSDHDWTQVWIDTPEIEEVITAHNSTTGLNVTSLNATVGDTVTFRLHYDAQQIDAKQHTIEIRDYLPLGTIPLAWFEHADYDPNATDAVPLTAYAFDVEGSPVFPTYYPDGNMLVWEFSELAVNANLTADVVAYVLNDDEHVTKDKGDQNLVTLSYRNSPGVVESKRSSVQIQYAEPDVKIARTISKDGTNYHESIEVNGQETVYVKLVLTNESEEDVNNSTAYNVVLTETLAGELLTPTLVQGTDELVGSDFSLSGSDMSFTLLYPLNAGESVTLVYSATVITDIGAGKEITQTAKVAYDSQSNPAEGRHYPDTDAANIEGPQIRMNVPDPEITYEPIHYGTTDHGTSGLLEVSDTDFTKVRVGDWVVYKVTVDVPTDDVAYDPGLTITLPGKQTVNTVFADDYDPSSFTGTVLTQDTDYSVDGNVTTFAASRLPETAGVDHVFYIRTTVTGISTGAVGNQQEAQTSTAEFTWRDLAGTGTLDDISDDAAITVTIPKLEVEWYYHNGTSFVPYDDENPISLSQDSAPIEMQFRIDNVGKNTAYDFVPVITVPLGFEITGTDEDDVAELSAPGGESVKRVATYPKVASLGTTAPMLQYEITVEMIEVPGSGASFDVDGTTGHYYATPYAYDSSSVQPQERYAPATDEAVLGVPNVSVVNRILETTNPDETTVPGTSAWIRPGDLVTYELSVTIPAGTQAFDMVVTDTISDHGNFDFITGSGTVTQDDTDILGASPVNYTAGQVTVDLGDSPSPDGSAVIYTITFDLRAKEDGTAPDEGSFDNGDTETINPSSSAVVNWNTANDDNATGKVTSPAQTTSLVVRQPDVSFTAEAVGTFDATTTREASYTITNDGPTDAIVPSFEVQVPDGFTITNISDSGTQVANVVTWTELTIPANDDLVVEFDLTVSDDIGAGETSLKLTSTLDDYHSTDAAVGENAGQRTKVYELDATDEQELVIAPLVLTAEVIDNTFEEENTTTVRPGDTLTYELTIDMLGINPSYDVILLDSGLDEQTIKSVSIKNSDETITLTEDIGYVIAEDFTEDTVLIVETDISTGTTDGTGSFTPSIEYMSKSDDTVAKQASADEMAQTIIEPSLTLTVEADPTILDVHEESSTVTVEVTNSAAAGTSVAYDVQVNLELTETAKFIYGEIDGTVSWTPEDGYAWNIPSIPVGGTATLTFTVTARDATAVGEDTTVTADLVEYYSLPGTQQGKGYTDASEPTVTVTVEGSHTLSEADPNPVELTAGKTATFGHTLTNTGAGSDIYELDVTSDTIYPATLSIDGAVVATGVMSEGAWAWAVVTGQEGHFVDGTPTIPLDAGESMALKLSVDVPVEVHYGPAPLTTYTMTATGQLSTNDVDVTDEVIVTGVTLDGWSSDIAYAELDDWRQPGYPNGDTLTLQAVSAVHVESVVALYNNGVHTSESMELTLANSTSYVEDGYKLWTTTHVVPESLAAGEYDVTFEALDLKDEDEVEVLETDETDGLKGTNNPFAILDSDVMINIIADKTELATPKETDSFTVTVTNHSSATSVANNAKLEITLPTGFVLDSIDNLIDLAGPLHEVSGQAGDTVIHWDIREIGIGESMDLKFTTELLADIEVATSVDVSAELIQYYSLPNEEGVKYGPLEDTVGIAISGSHTLSEADPNPVSLTAGKEATFAHTLKNTGAGSDLYELEVTSDSTYVTTLFIGGVQVATGRMVEGAWLWTIAAGHEDHFTDGKPSIALDADESIGLQLVAEVPATERAGTIRELEITATGDLSDETKSVTDTIQVAGMELDGWVSNQLWSKWEYSSYRSDWTESIYYPNASVKLSAISAVDATALTAAIYSLDALGAPDQLLTTLDMTRLNTDTVVGENKYIEDGYKLWQVVDYSLPKLGDIADGRYFVEFMAEYAEDGATPGEDSTPTSVTTDPGYNNYFSVKSRIDLVGTVTEQGDPLNLIADAEVTLKDLDGTVIAETTTDDTGAYMIEDVLIKHYVLEVKHPLFSDYSRKIYVIPSDPSDTQVRKDVELIDFIIQIEANPSTIIGDGVETTVLTVTILDKDGLPLEGVPVDVDSVIGTLMGSPDAPVEGEDTALTDEEGKAYVLYRSEKIDGLVSQEVPVTVSVSDPVRELYAEDIIYLILAPGAISGTVIDHETGQPVDQASVFVSSDFDGDGQLDFSATQTTGPDGKYKIAIPRGEIPYQVEITKPVMINGEPRPMTFKQQALPDIVDETEYVEYPSVNTATGVLLQRQLDQTEGFLQPQAYGEMKIEQIRWNELEGKLEVVPGGLTGTIDTATGIYSIEDLPYDPLDPEPLRFRIVREVLMSADDPELREIVMGTLEVQVNANGDIIIGEELIDPYGIITDSVTGDVIVDVEVKLYYADTARNRAKPSNTPHTLVPLPLLETPPFPPANNANPQRSDATGFYAWMVFSESDYYIIATKTGYETYNSLNDVGVISVEFDIVEHNFEMDPIRSSGGGGGTFTPTPAEDPANLAVSLYSNKGIYHEDDVIPFTLKYVNRTDRAVGDVGITLKLPEGFSVVDRSGSVKTGDLLTWSLGTLEAEEEGRIRFSLQGDAGSFTTAETIVGLEAEITSRTVPLILLEDDRSPLRIMLYSDRFVEQRHERYIKGYPDVTFRPEQDITRAEIAAIFARILDLEKTVTGSSVYEDVEPTAWYGEYIEAVSRAGLFRGYADGSFQPDQAITRAELSTVIANYLSLESRAPIGIQFQDTYGHWAANIIEEVYRHHILAGYPDGTFRPDAPMIRSEAVSMINRLLYRGPLANAESSFPDVSTSHWALGQVEESTRTHEYTRNADGSENMTRYIPEPLW